MTLSFKNTAKQRSTDWGYSRFSGYDRGAKRASRAHSASTVIKHYEPVLSPGFSELDDFLSRVSSLPGMAGRLANARKSIGLEIDSESPSTLAGLRRKAGLSQKQLADALGTSQPVISFYESGEREPKIQAVIALRDALGVDFDTLLGVLAK